MKAKQTLVEELRFKADFYSVTFVAHATIHERLYAIAQLLQLL